MLKFVHFHILFIVKFSYISSYGWSSLWLRHKTDPKKHRVDIIIYHIMLKQGVCHTVAFQFTLNIKYLKAKEELWKLKYFNEPTYNIQKNPSKKPKSFKIL